MNILYTNFHPGKGGGHTTYLTYLFNNISKLHSYSLNIFIAVPKNSKLSQDLKKKFSPRVFDVDFPGKPKNFFYIVKNIKIFANLIKQNQIDVVHTNGTPDHKIVMMCKWLYKFKYKIVRTKHDSLPIKQHWFAQKLYDNYTDHFIVVSNYQYKKISNRKLQRKTTVINNGVDLQYFQPRTKSNELINKFGISKTDLVFVSVAGSSLHKGWQYLVEATSKLDKETREKIKIFIVGNYPAQNLIEKYVNLKGMQKNVIFTGYINDVRNVISIADIGFVLSIEIETISFACREMMAMGRPVLVSDFAALSENIIHEVDGWVVKRNSSKEVEVFINSLPNIDLVNLSKCAYQKAQNEFGIEQFVEKTTGVYYSFE